MEHSTGEGWSLLRVRQRVLKVASRLLVHSRRVILVIGKQAVGCWLLALTLGHPLLVRRGPRDVAARRLAPPLVALPAVPLLAARARYPGRLHVCPLHAPPQQRKGSATLRE